MTGTIIAINITAGDAEGLARILDYLSMKATGLADQAAKLLQEALEDHEDLALDLVEISYTVPGEGTVVLDY